MIFTYNDAVGHDAVGHDAAADDDGGGDGDGDGESDQLLKKGTFLLLSLLSSFFFFSTTNKTELTQDKMQPPPRKVKHASALKVIHTEQLQKLQSKHQQEVELLEDIRVFSQKRSAIEKEYAQSLLKLTSSLLKKDIAIPPDIPREDGKNHKTAIIVWRQILEELEKVGKARLAASEIYYEKCAEPAKPLKNAKVQCLKKLVNQLSLIQSEVSQSVLEMTKAHKIYVADETQTSEARQKATEADEKLKRKSVGFFKSMTSLQRNCAKLSSRYEQCAIKSTSSRNDYLLAQSAANAHQIRYYSVDLPELMKALDGEVYEKIQEYFTIHTATSAEVSAIETNCFQKLSLEAEKISRNYNLQCFLHDSNVFTELLQYQFEPCCNDQVSKLSKDHGAEHQLEKEAKKWSSKISKESKVIREQNKALRSHQTTSKPDQGGGTSAEKIESQDPETLFEEIKQSIRRAETAKMKAEARIELLRTCGVNVDDYLSCVDSLGAEPDNISRTPSQASLRTESSGGPTEEPEPTYTHFDDDDDDYAEDIPDVTEPTPISPTATQNSSSSRQYPIQAQALYTFQATNPDELGMEENEDIEVIGDGDGDGWVQAKDSRGNVGFIPESYIRVLDQSGSTQPAAESIDSYDIPATAVDMSQASSAPHGALSTPDLPPAPDIPPATDMSAEDLETPTGQETEMPPPPDFTVTNHIEPPTEPTHYDVASSFSSGDLEVQQATAQNATEPTLQNLPLVPNDGEVWARALYDYEANTDDELSFTEGTLIRIVRKDETGIDDGFWQGEIDGQFGVFPSLVVEELIENGEPKQDLLTPVKGGPPDFVPPPPVMVTLPTPDRITPPFLSNGQASSSASAAESSTDSSQKQPALDSQQPTVDAVGPGDDSQVPAGSEVPVESTVVTEEKQSIDEVEGSADKITGLQDQTEEDKKETSKYSEDKTGSLDHSGSIDQKNASEQTQSQEQAGSLDKTDSIDKNFSEHSESFDQTGSLDQTGSIDDDGNEAQDKKKQEAPLISEVSNTKEEEEEKLETVTEEATTTSTTTSATTTTTKTEQDGSEAISDQKPVVKSEEKVEKEEKTEEKKVEEEEEKEEKEEEDNELEVLL